MKEDRSRDTYIGQRQMLHLIKNFQLLREGILPGVVRDLPMVRKGGSNKAPFVFAVEIAVEVERRLIRAKTDGLILLCIECFEISTASLAAYFQTEESQIERRRFEALRYVSGYSHKKSDYKVFYQHKKTGN